MLGHTYETILIVMDSFYELSELFLSFIFF